MVKYIARALARNLATRKNSNTHTHTSHTYSVRFEHFYESWVCVRQRKRAEFKRSIELQLSNWHGLWHLVVTAAINTALLSHCFYIFCRFSLARCSFVFASLSSTVRLCLSWENFSTPAMYQIKSMELNIGDGGENCVNEMIGWIKSICNFQ